MKIRVQLQLILLLSLLIILFIGAFLTVSYFSNKNVELLFSSRQDEKEKLFDNILKLKSSSLSTYAYDYTYWDEMVKLVEQGNMTFAKENIDPSLETYKANAVWVLKTDFSLVYSATGKDSAGLGSRPLGAESLTKAFSSSLFPHFYMLTDKGVLELDGAPIQPSSDIERKTKPHGYFLTARLWNSSYLNDIVQLTGTNIAVMDSSKLGRNDSDLNKGQIFFTRVLPGFDGSPAVRLQIGVDAPSILSISRTYTQQLALLIAFSLTFFVLFSFFLFRWIGNPIGVISKSLDKEDPSLLTKLRVDKGSEFAQLAELITKFFSQKEELTREKDLFEKKVVERTEELNIEKEDLSKANEAIGEGYLQLQQEKARLVSSINSLLLGFIMTDAKNEVFIANKAAASILGVNKPIITMADVKAKLGTLIDLDHYIEKAKKEKVAQEVKEVAFGNKFLHLFFSPIILLKEKEEYIGGVILFEDITEAKILDRSKDEFFSIASHELRTPLTAIRGNTSLILDFYRDKIKDKELAEMLDDIHDSSIRLIKIVNDFLDTSRLEQKRMEFKKDEFDFVELVEEVFKEIKANADQKKIYLKLETSDRPAKAVADRDRSKQVLFNLVGNAIKYTDEGGVLVLVSHEDKFFKISVKDTGKGVPEKNQALLFRKFQQAANSILTRDGVGGTGLGLYISKLMVEGMGGQIKLEESVENKGSTFAFTLPAKSEEKKS